MKRTLLFLLLFVLFPSAAFADETPDPDRKESGSPRSFAVEPSAGWAFGRWFGVPVTRIAAGLDITSRPKESPIAANWAELGGSPCMIVDTPVDEDCGESSTHAPAR